MAWVQLSEDIRKSTLVNKLSCAVFKKVYLYLFLDFLIYSRVLTTKVL